MAQDEDNAQSGEFHPTLTDTLYSSLELPEDRGQAMLIRILFEELLTALVKREALRDEELKSILDRAGERVSTWGKRAKQDIYQAMKEKGYPPSYVDEIIDRSTKSAEETLSSIRERIINKTD
ncbi:MAG: hypothetical protein WBP93_05245 [Pyrinomonadaceae bacterium]